MIFWDRNINVIGNPDFYFHHMWDHLIGGIGPQHVRGGGNWKSNSTLKASEKLCDALNAGDWDGSKVS